MKFSTVTTSLVASGLAGVAAAGPKVVSVDFTKTDVPSGSSKRALLRRAGTLNEAITSDGQLYYVNMSVGTPPQPLAVYIDTGSSDLWLPSTDPNSDFCDATAYGCGDLGGFNQGQSSTAKELDTMGAFGITYGDGTSIGGVYFTDNVAFGDTKLSNVTMALAIQGNTEYPSNGLMGVGYIVNESPTAKERQSRMLTPYPNIVQAMKDQGAISTLAYSIYLNDLQSGKGTVLFGGVDKAKYTGKLGVVPVQPDPAYAQYYASSTGTSFNGTYGAAPEADGKPSVFYTGLYAPLTQVSFGNTKFDLGRATVPTLLDSGTSIMYLPDKAAEAIFEQFGARLDRQFGPIVPCNAGNGGSFGFTFGDGGPTVNVDLSQIIRPFDTGALGRIKPPTLNGQTACRFGITGAGDSAAQPGEIASYILGDTFLTSAYVVFDLEQNQIGLAQANPNATSTSIVEISSTIPGDSTVTGQAFSLASTPASSLPVTTRRPTGATNLGVLQTLTTSAAGGSVATAAPVPVATSAAGSFGAGSGAASSSPAPSGTSGGAASSAAGGAAAGTATPLSTFKAGGNSAVGPPPTHLESIAIAGIQMVLGFLSGGLMISWL